jgi:3-oxoadipate enol-lactonase
MPTLTVKDINLYYETYGKGEPLVFISGFNADHTIWKNIVEYYSQNYQVILFDNRGIGRSEAPDYPYTIEMLADDNVEFCKALNIQSAYFVGLSMGGMILQTLAWRYPTLVRAAVLNNTMMKIDIRFLIYAQARLELIKQNVSSEIMTKLSLPWGLSSNYLNQPGIVESLIEIAKLNPYPTTETGFRNQLNALSTFDSSLWLHQISVPCLVIGSDEDSIAKEAHMEELAKKIPNAEYFCFNNAGHIPHIEQTQVYNKVVDRFLNDVNRARLSMKKKETLNNE